mmetsp:Transcript_4547/g.5234  ORF Transcript_4547/g.5234 Transcript_4547/m.5234 type:complete len:1732 (+) Transcript_4547:341-5536(+)
MRSKKTSVKKQKPLQLDCTSLVNHLTRIQNSIHNLPPPSRSLSSTSSSTFSNHNKPNLQMVNFTKGTLPKITPSSTTSANSSSSFSTTTSSSTSKTSEWYLLVASTPYTVSAQLVPVPKSRDNVVVPDFIQNTPISIWTCDPNTGTGTKKKKKRNNSTTDDYDVETDLKQDDKEDEKEEDESKQQEQEMEILNCHPLILFQRNESSQPSNSLFSKSATTATTISTSSASSSSSLSVSIVIGTTHNRVLSIQLSIFSYVGISGSNENNRFVLHKVSSSLDGSGESGSNNIEHNDQLQQKQRQKGIIEPLPIDTDEMIQLKMKKMMEIGGNSMSSLHSYKSNNSAGSSRQQQQDGISVTSGTAVTGNLSNTTTKSKWTPFKPERGVTSISPLYQCHHSNHNYTGGGSGGGVGGDFVWITYGDGTMVRLPKWGFFPLNNNDVGDDNDNVVVDVDRINGDLLFNNNELGDKLVKARVVINGTKKTRKKDESSSTSSTTIHNDDDVSIIPLPRFFPTLLSQPLVTTVSSSPTLAPNHHEDIDLKEEDSGSEIFCDTGYYNVARTSSDHEFYEAVSYNSNNKTNNNNESNTTPAITPPTLSFYTNEDQLYSATHDNAINEECERSTVQSIIRGGTTIIGGTAALAKGVLGGVMGVVLGRSSKTTEEEDLMKGMEIGVKNMMDNEGSTMATTSTISTLFPSLHEDATNLPIGTAMFDSPRRIVNVSIDPVDGLLMACADNLGRVQLIDLSTKQVVRMWKGLREAACHWIQFPFTIDNGIQTVKYLTIHSRERKIVEVFRLRHGNRVGKYSAGSYDAQVVQCVVALPGNESFTKCFLVQTSSSTKRCLAKEIMVHDDELNKMVIESSSNSNNLTEDEAKLMADNHQSLSEGTIQLQLLKQLLTSESAVPSDLDAVYVAFTQITAISDLSRALDLLAVASHFEQMGVNDASFHSEVIAHAQDQLNMVMTDEIIVTSNNPLIEELRNKIEFHSRMIASYNVLHRFESGGYCDNDDEEVLTKDKSSWVIEALSWIETAEAVCGQSIDSEIFHYSEPESILSFFTFAKSCLHDGQNTTSFCRNAEGDPSIYLCDSTRDRKNILLHIFRPLTKDIFIFKTTQQIFEHMGLQSDYEILLQYYGEWFMALPKAIIEKECLGIWCPTVRWLHDIVQNCMNDLIQEKKEQIETMPLSPLHKFCSESSDLPRAFLLATVCLEAVHSATKQLEDKTYGLIKYVDCVKPWEDLLRKLRMCLLVALRLHAKPIGDLPLTIKNVESGDSFSMYEWIARDELSFSHNQEEIAALEDASAHSKLSFYPTSAEGDKPSHWKTVQNSCKRSFPTDDKTQLPLLLFMKHYSNPLKLAAHRASLLAQMWGRQPESLDLLKDALAAIQSLGRDNDMYSSLLAAALLEIWQVHLRPIYRGLLFGFHEVHELCEEIITPLCQDGSWFRSLNKISMKIIRLLLSTTDSDSYEQMDEDLGDKDKEVWPKLLEEDIMIERLVRKSLILNESSLEAHNVVICALQLNDDLSLIPMCIDSFDTLFLHESLSLPIPPTFRANEYQLEFIDSAIRRQAMLAEGLAVDSTYLDDIVTLGRSWGLDKGYVLTQFFLIMYEIGKDDLVESLANSTMRLVDVDTFMNHGIAIVCVRLNAALIILKKAKQCRSILALLEADTCEWVKEQAVSTLAENPDIVINGDDGGGMISLGTTYSLILRMKRMSSVNRTDAYALSTMCETLMKAMDHVYGT